MVSRDSIVGITVLAFLVSIPHTARSARFSPAAPRTLSQQFAESDVVLVVQWADGRKADNGGLGITEYEITEVVKVPNNSLKKRDRISLVRYQPGNMSKFILMAKMGPDIEWKGPLEVTETSLNYIKQAPALEAPARLAYFLDFLESCEPLLANDAYAEFARASHGDIASLAKQMPHEKLREWVRNPEKRKSRLGLYGVMLGLCGNQEDAELMGRIIAKPANGIRLGIDGVMCGHLLLTGEKGLEMLDETKLKNHDVPFSETYAAMQAMRFMWASAPGRIGKERLRQSMRLLLDRPEIADLVIADLGRWKDWSVQDRLMKLYGAEDYNIPSIKRAIVRYLLASCSDENVMPRSHSFQAKAHLEALRRVDPIIVKQAEQFFNLK
jgi:hypothetical protein